MPRSGWMKAMRRELLPMGHRAFDNSRESSIPPFIRPTRPGRSEDIFPQSFEHRRVLRKIFEQIEQLSRELFGSRKKQAVLAVAELLSQAGAVVEGANRQAR